METTNGTTQKDNGRGYDDLRGQDEQRPLGESGYNSEKTGDRQQSGLAADDCQWSDTAWKLVPIRDTNPGKIFQRLELLEKTHLKYVHSHQDRLKARLGESEQDEEAFLRESNQIKSDLYHLAVAQQQNGNGNGHH